MSKWEISTWLYLSLLIVTNVVLTLVVSIGGYFDLKYLFKSMNNQVIDPKDDGRVLRKQNKEE
jgi:hypothetical protein